MIRYMLFSHQDKPSVPVPRSKLNETMLVDYADHPRKRRIPPVGALRMHSTWSVRRGALGRGVLRQRCMCGPPLQAQGTGGVLC